MAGGLLLNGHVNSADSFP